MPRGRTKRPETLADVTDSRLYRIGEVAHLLGVETSVLRFWETEFPQVAPIKAESKHRYYNKKQIETLFEIRHLLYEEKYTIEGARRQFELRAKGDGKRAADPGAARRLIVELRDEIAALRKQLKG